MGPAVVCYNVSLSRLDGGGRRVAAFLAACKSIDLAPEIVGIGPVQSAEMSELIDSPLHKFKRKMLPVPMRYPVEHRLKGFQLRENSLSLTPSANSWATRSKRSWIDFPDLWSEIAANSADQLSPLVRFCNKAQAKLWRRRESVESRRATVVSVASWMDQQTLGTSSVWMPTPVANDLYLNRNRPFQNLIEGKSPKTFGFLANFGYPPNRDAFNRLIQHWLPVLTQTEGSKIVVGGFDSDALPRTEGIELIGAVDSIADFYNRIDIALAPVERGGGMKVKVVEAMMHGVPVIATEHATIGLPPVISRECVLWERFASNIQRSEYIDVRDPRESADVTASLKQFTSKAFSQQFASIWHERMHQPSGPH